MTKFLARILCDETGGAAIEYALIAMLVSTAIVAGLVFLGDGILSAYNYVVELLISAIPQ